MTDPVTLVLAAIGAVILLSMLMTLMAARADHDTMELSKVPRRDGLDAQIADKEAELERLRTAIDARADRAAEAAAQERRLEELRLEWDQMADRRREVEVLQGETDSAQTALADARGELAEAARELADVRDELAAARRLEGEVEMLEARKGDLATELDALRRETSDLEALRREAETLGARVDDARAEIARLDGLLQSREDAEAEARARRNAALTALAETEAERDRMRTEAEALRGDLRSTEDALDRATRMRGTLDRETATLQDRISEHEAEIERLMKDRVLHAEAEEKALSARHAAETGAKEAHDETRRLGERVRSEHDEIETLAARRAFLEAEIERLNSSVAGESTGPVDGGEGGVDVMSPPPALLELGKLDKAPPENEDTALLRVERHLEAIGLRYPRRVVRAFHTSMKVNDTAQMTVLSGISGTGKSQLPRRYAEAMGIGFLPVPVQPRWDSPQDLMGFYNYIEKRFRPTDMARALYHMDYTREHPSSISERMLMVLLDEMNLARVEYYFSDFLSRLEGRPERGRVEEDSKADSELELELRRADDAGPQRVFPGYNLLFAGTMNEDESTQTLSDKVVDRANVMRFAAPAKVGAAAPGKEASRPDLPGAMMRSRWDGWIRPPATGTAVEAPLQRMVDIMTQLERPFGYRLQRAIRAYVANYPAEPDAPTRVTDALADQVEMRLLPKLRGLEVEQAREGLAALKQFIRDDLRDEVLAEAVERSTEVAEEGTGQFVWRGVSRALSA